MGIAFETAIAALHTRGEVDPPRDTIARFIIDLAKTGERDPERLCEAALKAVPYIPWSTRPILSRLTLPRRCCRIRELQPVR